MEDKSWVLACHICIDRASPKSVDAKNITTEYIDQLARSNSAASCRVGDGFAQCFYTTLLHRVKDDAQEAVHIRYREQVKRTASKGPKPSM